jgi:hypothetical protein
MFSFRSAYSLSGHISISVQPGSFFFDNRTAVRLLLQSLKVTFEGQSELLTPHTGYSAFRICSVSRELVPTGDTELNTEDHDDSGRPCTWNVVFNIPIPGWLPATSTFGDAHHGPAGVRYYLTATAQFMHLEDRTPKYFSLSSLCAPFFSKTRCVSALPCEITLDRAYVPPRSSSAPASFPSASFNVETLTEKSTDDDSRIPSGILKELQVMVSVPEHVTLDDEASFPFSIRFRPGDLSEEDRRKLRIADFSVEIEQIEKYRYVRVNRMHHLPLTFREGTCHRHNIRGNIP